MICSWRIVFKYIWGTPDNEDDSIFGSMWGSLYLEKLPHELQSKLQVSPTTSPITVPYTILHNTLQEKTRNPNPPKRPFKEFRSETLGPNPLYTPLSSLDPEAA